MRFVKKNLTTSHQLTELRQKLIKEQIKNKLLQESLQQLQNSYALAARWLELLPDSPLHLKSFSEKFNKDGAEKSFYWVNKTLQSDAPPALQIIPYQRFGNNVRQLLHAVYIAKKIGAKTIYYEAVPGISASACYDDLEILCSLPPKDCGEILAGTFFLREPFSEHFLQDLAPHGALSYRSIAQKYVAPLMSLRETAPSGLEKNDLVIHLRAGDVFSTFPHPLYGQPPLAFYCAVLVNHLKDYPGSKAILVFEDRQNPVIEALEHYMASQQIPFLCQSGLLLEDYAFLIHASHMVTSIGTFTELALLLNDALQTVHMPGNWVGRHQLTLCHKQTKRYIYHYYHLRGEGWANTEEQRSSMLSYPVEEVRYEIVTPSCFSE